MKLPDGHLAKVDRRKLTDYCLSPTHPRGRHKARVFAAALGLGPSDADDLRTALLEAAAEGGDARAGTADEFGQRYELDFEMTGPAGTAMIRSCWIIPAGSNVPRLVTCYVL